MKKQLLLMLMLAIFPLGSYSYDFMADGVAYRLLSLDDLTCEVTEGCVTQNGVLNIPATVEYKGKQFTVLGIGDNACKNQAYDDKVKVLNLPNGITYIGRSAFEGQEIEVIRIPNTVKSIGQLAFYANLCTWNSTYLQLQPLPIEIIIEDGTELLEGAIYTGSWLPFHTTYPQKVYLGRNIADNVLSDALFYHVEELTIGDEVTELKHGQLLPLNSLYPETSLFDLDQLRVLTIGKGLSDLPYFKEGDKLEKIYLRSETPQSSYGFNDNTYLHTTLYVPEGTKSVYEQAEVWKKFWTIEEYSLSGAPEPYAALSDDGKTVTFYYDTQKTIRGGVVEINSGNSTPAYVTATKAVFDTSFANYQPTSTASWFYDCQNLASVDGIENLNTSQVTDMRQMFWRCKSLTSLDLSNFRTENVTAIAYMFCYCSALANVNLTSFNTEKVTDMARMFSDCQSLTSLDLSTFNTSKVDYVYSMFEGCTSLVTIYADENLWNLQQITHVPNYGLLFYNCTSLVGGNGTTYDASNSDIIYARIDKPGRPGYLTSKSGSGIKAIDNGKLAIENGTAPVYNLNGQRVCKPSRGLYIVNGRKVMK